MNELPPIVVKVKSMQGPMLDIVCSPYSTVQQFKVLIEEKSQVSPDNQRLIYLGKVLKDPLTLESYDIRDNCVVHLVGRCPPTFEIAPDSPMQTTTTTTTTSASNTEMPDVQFVAASPPQQHLARNRFSPMDLFRMMGQIRHHNNPNPSQRRACFWDRYRCHSNSSVGSTANTVTPPPMTPPQCTVPSPQCTPSPPPTNTPQLELELDQAITRGCMDRVQSLVTQGANVNKGGLHKACMFGQKEIVKYLIERGAKIDLKLASGETCMHTCAFYGQNEIIEYLMTDCGANIYERTNDGKTALMLAVYNNHRQVVESLLQHGASVYDNDVHGTSPLLMAAQKGNKELVELLLKYGARVDTRDVKGRTALHFSASGGFPNIVALLLSHGAPINAMNSNKETALHYAAYHRKRDCLVFLLSQGADVNIVSNSGSALSLARSKGFQDIEELLVQFGAIV